MSRIIYIANARIPTERAHGVQMTKMCEQFAKLGKEVIMLAPTRKNKITDDPFDFYRIARNFRIIYLWCPDLMAYGPIGFGITTWLFSFISALRALLMGFDFVYSRDGRALWVLSWFTRKFGWNIHDDQRKWWARRVLRTCSGIVTTNRALVPLHRTFAGMEVPALVAPNGVEPAEFAWEKSKQEIREELGLRQDAKVVVYTGHLYAYKGVGTLALAARDLPNCDFFFVGGREADVASFRERYKDITNIHLLGHKPHHRVFMYLRAADVLVIPNSAKDEFSSLYTSPIKLFEYAGSKTPIVASDLPSIREIVDDSEVFYVVPDDARRLGEAIRYIFDHKDEAQERATRTAEKAEGFTWARRVESIVNFYAI